MTGENPPKETTVHEQPVMVVFNHTTGEVSPSEIHLVGTPLVQGKAPEKPAETPRHLRPLVDGTVIMVPFEQAQAMDNIVAEKTDIPNIPGPSIDNLGPIVTSAWVAPYMSRTPGEPLYKPGRPESEIVDDGRLLDNGDNEA